MIDVSGDVIYFMGRPVGCIMIPNGTLRDAFEEALEPCESGLKEKVEELEDEVSALESTLSEIKDLCG